jgi:hypothetical protein
MTEERDLETINQKNCCEHRDVEIRRWAERD